MMTKIPITFGADEVVASKSSVVVFRTFVVVPSSIQAAKSSPRVKVLVVRFYYSPEVFLFFHVLRCA